MTRAGRPSDWLAPELQADAAPQLPHARDREKDALDEILNERGPPARQ